jgi:acylphosphatase
MTTYSSARHVNVRVTGRVQGVFFRATTKGIAESLGLTGFVRNEADGSVYIEAEGEAGSVEKFLAWCRMGPPQAAVSTVEVTDGSIRGFKEFVVVRG